MTSETPAPAPKKNEPLLTGDLWVGAVLFRKGVAISTVQEAINRLHNTAAHPEAGAVPSLVV